MYTVKGFYDINGVTLQTPVRINEPVPVLVTFLSEDVKPVTSKEIVKPYQEKAVSFNMGLEPDEEYAEFLMSEYYNLYGYIEEYEVNKDEER